MGARRRSLAARLAARRAAGHRAADRRVRRRRLQRRMAVRGSRAARLLAGGPRPAGARGATAGRAAGGDPARSGGQLRAHGGPQLDARPPRTRAAAQRARPRPAGGGAARALRRARRDPGRTARLDTAARDRRAGERAAGPGPGRSPIGMGRGSRGAARSSRTGDHGAREGAAARRPGADRCRRGTDPLARRAPIRSPCAARALGGRARRTPPPATCSCTSPGSAPCWTSSGCGWARPTSSSSSLVRQGQGLDWLAEDYPQLFAAPDLDQRLWLYELGYMLRAIIWWPPDHLSGGWTPAPHPHAAPPDRRADGALESRARCRCQSEPRARVRTRSRPAPTARSGSRSSTAARSRASSVDGQVDVHSLGAPSSRPSLITAARRRRAVVHARRRRPDRAHHDLGRDVVVRAAGRHAAVRDRRRLPTARSGSPRWAPIGSGGITMDGEHQPSTRCAARAARCRR